MRPILIQGRDGRGAAMRVTSVSASLRLATEFKAGWKTVELGAEATVAPGASLSQAMDELYVLLAEELVDKFRHGRELRQAAKAEAQQEDDWVIGGP